MAGSDQNLQDILRTLSSFTTPQPRAGTQLYAPPPPHATHWDDLEEGEYDPASLEPNTTNSTLNSQNSTYRPPIPPTQNAAFLQSVPQTRPPAQPHLTPAPRDIPNPPLPSSAAPSSPNPSLITTWPAAMAHLRPLLGSSTFTSKINRMIKNQRIHERQWHAGREALRTQQSERSAKRVEIADVLKAVGGKVLAGSVTEREPESEAREMARYDVKVYRAMGEMQRGMGVELSALGVPFFCIRDGVVVDESDGREGERRRRLVVEGRGVDDGRERLTREELVALQRRMLKFLEESCME